MFVRLFVGETRRQDQILIGGDIVCREDDSVFFEGRIKIPAESRLSEHSRAGWIGEGNGGVLDGIIMVFRDGTPDQRIALVLANDAIGTIADHKQMRPHSMPGGSAMSP